jgi:hypothetical protein
MAPHGKWVPTRIIDGPEVSTEGIMKCRNKSPALFETAQDPLYDIVYRLNGAGQELRFRVHQVGSGELFPQLILRSVRFDA